MKRTKQFELKPCSVCGSEYKHYASKRNELCKPCTTKEYLRRNRLKEDEYKKPYPLDDKARKRRYTKLRQGLAKCETREQKSAFYDAVINEMIETGIYLWCIDLRMPVKPQERGSGIRGRKPNNGTDPKKKWPDTRHVYEQL